jgi:hypothetical protein
MVEAVMGCLRIVLDFVADQTSPRAKDELRGYLKTMVQQRNLGIVLGGRALESLGFAGVRLLEATWETQSGGERVESGGQRVEEGGAPALRRDGTSGEPTNSGERKKGMTV